MSDELFNLLFGLGLLLWWTWPAIVVFIVIRLIAKAVGRAGQMTPT